MLNHKVQRYVIPYENAKVEVEKPFSKESELNEKLERLQELNVLLNLNRNENEIINEEPDEKETLSLARKKEYER